MMEGGVQKHGTWSWLLYTLTQTCNKLYQLFESQFLHLQNGIIAGTSPQILVKVKIRIYAQGLACCMVCRSIRYMRLLYRRHDAEVETKRRQSIRSLTCSVLVGSQFVLLAFTWTKSRSLNDFNGLRSNFCKTNAPITNDWFTNL